MQPHSSHPSVLHHDSNTGAKQRSMSNARRTSTPVSIVIANRGPDDDASDTDAADMTQSVGSSVDRSSRQGDDAGARRHDGAGRRTLIAIQSDPADVVSLAHIIAFEVLPLFVMTSTPPRHSPLFPNSRSIILPR